jgi:hypothetical protein
MFEPAFSDFVDGLRRITGDELGGPRSDDSAEEATMAAALGVGDLPGFSRFDWWGFFVCLCDGDRL